MATSHDEVPASLFANYEGLRDHARVGGAQRNALRPALASTRFMGKAPFVVSCYQHQQAMRQV